jgi:hypothetical protein
VVGDSTFVQSRTGLSRRDVRYLDHGRAEEESTAWSMEPTGALRRSRPAPRNDSCRDLPRQRDRHHMQSPTGPFVERERDRVVGIGELLTGTSLNM